MADDQFQERCREADQAVREAIGTLIARWADEDSKPGADGERAFSLEPVIRPAVVGSTAAIVEMAFDWGTVGDSAEAIAEGFRKTAAGLISRLGEAHEVGWAAKEGERRDLAN